MIRTLWSPAPDWRTSTRIGAFVQAAEAAHPLKVETYDDLWRWSVEQPEAFWSTVWDHFGVRSSTERGPVLPDARMPGANWFPSARVSYPRHLLEDADPERRHDDDLALIAHSQTRAEQTLTFAELRDAVARVRAGLQRLGVRPGTGWWPICRTFPRR